MIKRFEQLEWNEDWEEDEPIKNYKYPEIEEYMPEKFKEFLLDNNCFDQFCNNLLNSKNTEYFHKEWETFEDLFTNSFNIRDYINLAFHWNKTKQGHDFWEKLHSKSYKY